MKKLGIILMLFSIVVNCVSLRAFGTESTPSESTVPASDLPLDDFSNMSGLDAVDALLGTEKLVDNVRSAVLFEVNSQTLMYAWNADAQMYPASFVKIMTALVAIEKGALTELVTVKQSAVASVPHDAVSVDLVSDEVLSLGDLLYCLIVGSANDAAAVIAEHIAGSQQEFVKIMNEYAAEFGCTGTHFMNPHGLHDDNQHTTARDAARILNIAMQNAQFREIFTTTFYSVPATNKSEERSISTGNSMMDTTSRLYYDGRVIGGRTGVTQDGRRCLAAASESNGMLMISIVMGAESVYQEDGYSAISIGGYQETTKLLDYCFNDYKTARILFPGLALRQVSVAEGDSDLVIGAKETLIAVLPKAAEVNNLTFRYSDKLFSAPVEEGQLISNVQVWSGNICVAQADLYALNSVRSAAEQQNLVQHANIEWPFVITIAAAVTLLTVGILLVVQHRRRIRVMLRSFRRKRRRRDRKGRK